MNWTDPNNWVDGVVPGPGDDVVINAGPYHTVKIASGTQTIKSLVSNSPLVLSGGTLDVPGAAGAGPYAPGDAGTITVNNTFTLEGGTLAEGHVLSGLPVNPFVAGRLGSHALTLDGSQVSATVANAVDGHLDLGSDFTLEAWVRFDTLPSGSVATIISKDEGSGTNAKWIFGYANEFNGISNMNATVFHINVPGSGSVWLQSDAWTPVTLKDSPVPTWYHLALVKSGSTFTFYKNGVANGMATTALAPPTVNAPVVLGMAEDSYRLSGVLDDVRMWNVARSAGDIAAKRTAQLTGSEAGLQGYWALNEASGTTMHDLTASHSDGTVVGLGSTGIYITGGSVTLNGVTLDEDVMVSGGTLSIAGETTIGGGFSISSANLQTTGHDSVLSVTGSIALAGVGLTASDGSMMTFPGVATLANVNLTASGGGQILFPAATSYTGYNYGNTTIEASDPGSRIDLPNLQTFYGGGEYSDIWGGHYFTTYVKALGGGSIVLSGEISHRNEFTVDGTGSSLGVSGITKLDGTALTVNASHTLSFDSATEVTNSSLTAAGVTLNFPVAEALSNVSMLASGGGQILFPAATSYTGYNYGNTTIEASDPGSRIDLPSLQTFYGGGEYSDIWGGHYFTTYVKVLTGGTVVLKGAISHRNDFAVEGSESLLDVQGVASLADANVTVRLGSVVAFTSAASLANVNLVAGGGGQILLPAATSYKGYDYGNTTIQASDPGSKIDFPSLETFYGGGEYSDIWGGHYFTTFVKALEGGSVVISGAVSHRNDFTVDGMGSSLGVGQITELDGTTLTVNTSPGLTFDSVTNVTNASMTAANVTLNFPLATTLSNVNLAANGGGQILFPAATSYTGYNYGNTTIEASDPGSKIDLPNLQTFYGGGEYSDIWGGHYFTTYVKALGGGSVVLSGAISHRNDIAIDGSGGKMDLTRVLSIGGAPKLTVAGGEMDLAGGASVDSTLEVSGDGMVMLGGGQRFASMSIAGSGRVLQPGSAAALLVVATFTISDEGTLDLGNGALVQPYTNSPSVSQYQTWIRDGRLMTSHSEVPGFSMFGRGPVVFDNTHAKFYSWHGESFPVNNFKQVITTYDYFGDANLDGIVDPSDYAIVDGAIGLGSDAATGDLNGDGKVDPSDYAQIDGSQGAGLRDDGIAGPPLADRIGVIPATKSPGATPMLASPDAASDGTEEAPVAAKAPPMFCSTPIADDGDVLGCSDTSVV